MHDSWPIVQARAGSDLVPNLPNRLEKLGTQMVSLSNILYVSLSSRVELSRDINCEDHEPNRSIQGTRCDTLQLLFTVPTISLLNIHIQYMSVHVHNTT